ncbi:MAG TPA: hypothetical protein VM406_11360 [Noviherbaspirillum sp.]|nr:hypothetical protein [Noviherbaspirillum sp.]
MSKELEKASRAPVPFDAGRALHDTLNDGLAQQPPPGFVRFRYTCTEIHSHGGQVDVRMRQTRYEDGHLTTEECEGTMDRDAFRREVQARQVEAIENVFGLARLLLAPLFGSARGSRRSR